jgi:AraC family transcriptional regulator
VFSGHYQDELAAINAEPRQGRTSVLVQPELQWQIPPKRSDLSGEPSIVALARWTGSAAGESLELYADHVGETHFITCSLRHTKEHYWIGSRYCAEGTILPGRIFMQGPTTSRRRSVIDGAFDFFRIYFDPDVLAECSEDIHGRGCASPLVLFDAHFTDDKIIRELTKSLVNLGEDSGALGPAFVEGAGLALALHLVANYAGQRGPQRAQQLSPLAKWRLKRVIDYIEEHLDQSIHLADLGSAAGLSRMHFAAQFRAATGHTPHTYVMLRRIAVAQQLLVEHKMSIAAVAGAVGFRTHAHFTSVFKKLVGTSPVDWRNDALR